jgi:flagellar hook-basal body complex protein FliE
MDTSLIGSQRIAPAVEQKNGLKNIGPAKGFSDALQHAVNNVASLQNTAGKAVENVQMGNTANLHEAMIALEKADISFRTMLQVRNKIIESYQEIMRMQV